VQHNNMRQGASSAHNPDSNPGFDFVTLVPSLPGVGNSSASWGPLLSPNFQEPNMILSK
jgi:hypothetical protein